MSAPDSGYALVRLPGPLDADFGSSPLAKESGDYLERIRESLGFVAPQRYRGIGRYPLNADYTHVAPGRQWDVKLPAENDAGAMGRLREMLGIKGIEFPEEGWLIDGPWLIPGLPAARELQRLLEQPELFEIVEVARFPARTSTAGLGFDLGYWASGNFSLICDCAVWPIWHPPHLDALDELHRLLGSLNDNVLFPDIDAASNFAAFYRSQPWAEIEVDDGGRFELIEVALTVD